MTVNLSPRLPPTRGTEELSMPLSDLLRKLWSRAFRQPAPGRRRRRGHWGTPSQRPTLEWLECRTMPATFSGSSSLLFLSGFGATEQIEVTKAATDQIQITLTT